MLAMDINTASSWVGVLVMAVFPALLWAARHIMNSVTKMDKELRNNGGSSMRDAIDRIEKRQKKDRKEHRAEIAEIRTLLTAHLDEFE